MVDGRRRVGRPRRPTLCCISLTTAHPHHTALLSGYLGSRFPQKFKYAEYGLSAFRDSFPPSAQKKKLSSVRGGEHHGAAPPPQRAEVPSPPRGKGSASVHTLRVSTRCSGQVSSRRPVITDARGEADPSLRLFSSAPRTANPPGAKRQAHVGTERYGSGMMLSCHAARAAGQAGGHAPWPGAGGNSRGHVSTQAMDRSLQPPGGPGGAAAMRACNYARSRLTDGTPVMEPRPDA